MIFYSFLYAKRTIFFFLLVLCYSKNVFAQDLEPRVYANLPKGVNVIAGSYGYLKGNVVTEPTLPIEDFVISSNNFGLGYIKTFSLAKKLARVQVILPFTILDGKATVNGDEITGNRTGIADMRIRFGINLLGSPALDRKEFSQFQQKTIFGVSLVTSVPTGKYYNDKRINIGANRWGFKPEVGVSKRFKHIYAELYSGIWFYTENTDFLNGNTLKQDPVLSFQGHASYYFKNQMWVGININWFSGGKTLVDDVPAGNLINSSRIGCTWSVPLSKAQSMKLQLNTGTFKDLGLNYDSVTLSYQYVFF